MPQYLNVELTKDIKSIKKVFLALWDDISSDDEQDIKDKLDQLLQASVEEDIYFKINKGKNLVGIIHFEFINEDTYEIHMNMLPNYRGSIAKEAADKAIASVKTMTNFRVLQAVIPTMYTNVIKFTLNYGLVPTGELKNSWLKNGIMYNSIIYQMRV